MKQALILIAGILAATAARAQNGLQTKEVFMYKNGYTYVHAEGNVNTSNGVWSLSHKEIPNALFGTIWFESAGGIQYILRQNDTLEKAVAMPDLEQMLKASLGKKVKLTIQTDGNSVLLEGVVQKIFEDKLNEGKYNSNPAVVTVRTASGDVVIYRSTVNRALFAEFENGTEINVTEKVIEARLSVHFKDKTKQVPLGMVYVERHDAWAPIYRLELKGENKAHLTLGAEIKAGKLDISGAKLNLVVAQPTVFSPYLFSCLTGEKVWDGYNEGSYSEGRTIDNSISVAKDDVDVEVSGSKGEDYHIYQIKNFSLQKEHTAYVQILESDVQVEHSYQCVLPVINEYVQLYSNNWNGPVNQNVYHWVKFKNPAKEPLTAAPVFVEGANSGGGNLVLGQPVMNTVAVGGEAKIQIAQSLNIPVTQEETEKSRIENERVISRSNENYSFDLITVEAKLHLENQDNKEVVVKLERNIQGKPLKSDFDWKVDSRTPLAGSPNSNNVVSWEVKLKPGEKKDIVYSYQYYLRIY